MSTNIILDDKNIEIKDVSFVKTISLVNTLLRCLNQQDKYINGEVDIKDTSNIQAIVLRLLGGSINEVLKCGFGLLSDDKLQKAIISCCNIVIKTTDDIDLVVQNEDGFNKIFAIINPVLSRECYYELMFAILKNTINPFFFGLMKVATNNLQLTNLNQQKQESTKDNQAQENQQKKS